MKKKRKFLKYFELPIEEIPQWGFEEWTFFAVESVWLTIMPFMGGVVLAETRNLIWLLFMILPVFFKLDIEKHKKRKKRIYIED